MLFTFDVLYNNVLQVLIILFYLVSLEARQEEVVVVEAGVEVGAVVEEEVDFLVVASLEVCQIWAVWAVVSLEVLEWAVWVETSRRWYDMLLHFLLPVLNKRL